MLIGAVLLPPCNGALPAMNDDDMEEDIDEELIDDGVFKLLLFIDVPFLYGLLSKEVVL